MKKFKFYSEVKISVKNNEVHPLYSDKYKKLSGQKGLILKEYPELSKNYEPVYAVELLKNKKVVLVPYAFLIEISNAEDFILKRASK